jgi:hypothetical protein
MKMSALLLTVLLLLGGCAGQQIHRKDGTKTAREYSLSDLAKTDVDMITDLTRKEVMHTLRVLAEKLYRRNPQEYHKVGLDTPEEAAARIFEYVDKGKESPLALMNWQDNFGLAFQEGYNGDRVYAFMSALTTMVMASYDYRSSFYVADRLDAQKLYNCARNIEVAVWKLSNAKLPNGGKVLVTNSMDGEVQNLSFEREFGKLIADQDLLALIIEDRSSRTINRVIENVASFAFLPI